MFGKELAPRVEYYKGLHLGKIQLYLENIN
jgi:hypothetical protein